jgi:hypothetical protein
MSPESCGLGGDRRFSTGLGTRRKICDRAP